MGLTPTREGNLLRALLDRGYTRTAGAAIRAIVGNSTGGIMEQRLKELDEEAARLAEKGEKLTPDNPVVRAVLADFDDVMAANGVITGSVSGNVQTTGMAAAGPSVRQASIPGFTDAQLATMGIQWNTPSPEAINAAANYVTDPAFVDKLSGYSDGTVEQVQNVILNGFVAGKGPLAIARDVRRSVSGLPAHNANQLLRTLQLTSFRESQVVHRVANSHILTAQIRVATLDDRTCMSCIALHGAVLPINARINDHHLGRCTSVTIVRGLPAPEIESGEEWFSSRTETQQRAQMGDEAFKAWKDGKFELGAYPRPYTDDVFGDMIGTNSLKGIIGKN